MKATPEQHKAFEQFLVKACNLEKSIDSCWLIEFEDGAKLIMSEAYYAEEKERNFAGRKILVEAHWHSIKACRFRNRGVFHVGL
jgi:hypothetical protein